MKKCHFYLFNILVTSAVCVAVTSFEVKAIASSIESTRFTIESATVRPTSTKSTPKPTSTPEAVPNTFPEVIQVLAPKSQFLSELDSAAEFVNHSLMGRFNQTIADDLSLHPSVSLNGQGGQFQSYSIRGFSKGRIRTEVDGIPIVTDRRAGNAASFIASDLVSSALVLSGPRSTLYGSGSMGGVVSLSTEGHDSGIKLTTQPQNDALAVTFTRQKDLLTQGLSFEKSGNTEDFDSNELNTQFKRISALHRHTVQLSDYTVTTSLLTGIGKDIGKSNIRFPDREVSLYPEETHVLSQLHVSAQSGWQGKVFHHYQNWDSVVDRIDRYQSQSDYQSHTLGAQFIAPVDEFDLDVGLDWLSRKGVRISSATRFYKAPFDGIDAVNIERSSGVSYQESASGQEKTPDQKVVAGLAADVTVGSEIQQSYLNGEEDQVGAFLKGQFNGGQMRFDWGLRYDWLKQVSVYDHFLSGSAALSYSFNKAWELNVNVANGFRSATLSERFFVGPTPRAYVVGNPELLPEQSKGIEFGLNHSLGFDWSLSVCGYYYQVDDYIERVQLVDERPDDLQSFDSVLSYRNTESATIRGVEAAFSWHINDGLEYRFSYQKQQGLDEKDARIDDIQPQRIDTALILNTERFSWLYRVSYQPKVESYGPSELPREQVWLHNLGLDYHWSADISAQLNITNLTNQAYFGSLDKNAPIQAGRTLKLAFKWLF